VRRRRGQRRAGAVRVHPGWRPHVQLLSGTAIDELRAPPNR
jgi:hypothetical protein